MERWRRIDLAPEATARALLRVCCGASRWIDRMLARRPFASQDDALTAAQETWWALTPDDWREAFAHHPRIGDIGDLRNRLGGTRWLAEHEQAGVSSAPSDVLTALLEGNRAYETRFGYIFIVCASGRSAAEMLELLRARLTNDPNVEIRIAAGEHAKICALRLTGSSDER